MVLGWRHLTLGALLNCRVCLIPRFASPTPAEHIILLTLKRKIMLWICSCLAGDYWVLGHGVARGYLNYFKDAAIASPLAFAINQLYFYGLVLLTKSELCSFAPQTWQSQGKPRGLCSQRHAGGNSCTTHWGDLLSLSLRDLQCFTFLLQWERRVKMWEQGRERSNM